MRQTRAKRQAYAERQLAFRLGVVLSVQAAAGCGGSNPDKDVVHETRQFASFLPVYPPPYWLCPDAQRVVAEQENRPRGSTSR
jgi:hypothetical protein